MRKIPTFLSIVSCGAFAFAAAFAPFGAARAAQCNLSDLIRCIDSVCGVNVSVYPGTRCATCGSIMGANSGIDQKFAQYKFGGKIQQMQQLSIGASASKVLNPKDFANSPSPGQRYVAVRSACFAKLPGCTDDDAIREYDPLIMQSCKAVITESEYAAALAAVKATPSVTQCSNQIYNCMVAELRCGADWTDCFDDAVFSRHFGECDVVAGCTMLSAADTDKLRASVAKLRDGAAASAAAIVDKITNAYTTARTTGFAMLTNSCDGSGKNDCIASVCEYLPSGSCGCGGVACLPNQRSLAALLCSFWDSACVSLSK